MPIAFVPFFTIRPFEKHCPPSYQKTLRENRIVLFRNTSVFLWYLPHFYYIKETNCVNCEMGLPVCQRKGDGFRFVQVWQPC